MGMKAHPAHPPPTPRSHIHGGRRGKRGFWSNVLSKQLCQTQGLLTQQNQA